MSTAKHRNSLLVITAALVAGSLFHKADSFWGVVSTALIIVMALFLMLLR